MPTARPAIALGDAAVYLPGDYDRAAQQLQPFRAFHSI